MRREETWEIRVAKRPDVLPAVTGYFNALTLKLQGKDKLF